MRKNFISLILIFVIVFSFMSCSKSEPSESSDSINDSNNEQQKNADSSQYNYDSLQNLFLSITENTTVEDIEKYISDSDLQYTLEHYNDGSKTYSIAFTEGASLQSYADPGDHLEISFDEDEPCKIRVAQYVQNNKASYSAVYYNHGIFWDFSDSEKMDGNYAGYYISDSFGEDKGITIKYSNGNETNTNYFKYDSAEEVIKKVIDFKD